MFVEIPESIEERGCPGIASARGIGCFGDLHLLARFKPVAQAQVEGIDRVGPGQPLLR